MRLRRRVWAQNYLPLERGVRWRTPADGIPPAARFISSPYDPEAHYARKRTTSWIGYEVHLTEACEPETPNLITHVGSDLAPAADGAATPAIHAALRERDLLPSRPLVDTGYLDAELLVASRRDYGVDLVGRPGVEGTISQGVRAFGLRRSRYIGLAKTDLGHVLTAAAAINLARLSDWLAGIPRAATRRSPLRALLLQPLPG